MFQEDLQPITYLPVDPKSNLLAVGWLSSDRKFPIGSVSQSVYEKLKELSKDPWQPFVTAGMHACEICQFEGESSTSANLFIPLEDRLFVAPAMIVHYINAHHYRPPKVFCDAVLQCPVMRSMAYRQALVACGGHKLVLPRK